MEVRRCSLASAVLAVAMTLQCHAARGQTRAPPVDIFVAGTPDALSKLESAIGVAERPVRWVRIGALDVADVVKRPSQARAGAARAWIDCSRPDRVRIYFANWDTERFLVRDVPLPAGTQNEWSELTLEAVGQVIDSSLSALGANARTGMSRAEMVSALASGPVAALPPTRAAWGATLGVFYAVQAFAPEQPVEQGPGLAATAGPREGRWRWAAWVSAQYRLPETIDTPLIGVRLDTLALRGGGSVTRRASARVDLGLELGLGADVVHIAPRQGSAEHAVLSSDRFSASYAVELACVGTVHVGPAVSLWGALLADADLDERHYDVVVDGSNMRVVTPWAIRPGIMAGVAWR
jgi:hypothetical protein